MEVGIVRSKTFDFGFCTIMFHIIQSLFLLFQKDINIYTTMKNYEIIYITKIMKSYKLMGYIF